MLLFLRLKICVAFVVAITQDQVRQARTGCENLLKADILRTGGFVRLAFHDCAGGCNGCVNMKLSGHAGLEPYIKPLENVWKKLKFENFISRADFWALCAVTAIDAAFKRTIPDGNSPSDAPPIRMRFGRKDCNSSHYDNPTTESLPNATESWRASLQYFKDEFNFDHMETVAILGAHNLGGAHPEASGYVDKWVEHENNFDNSFFKSLLNTSLNWTMVNFRTEGEPKWQWSQNGQSFLMLNTDMSLVKDIKPNTHGYVAEKLSEIKDSPLVSYVQLFAANNREFLRQFGFAFTKMIEKTDQKLEEASNGSSADAISNSTHEDIIKTVQSSTSGSRPVLVSSPSSTAAKDLNQTSDFELGSPTESSSVPQQSTGTNDLITKSAATLATTAHSLTKVQPIASKRNATDNPSVTQNPNTTPLPSSDLPKINQASVTSRSPESTSKSSLSDRPQKHPTSAALLDLPHATVLTSTTPPTTSTHPQATKPFAQTLSIAHGQSLDSVKPIQTSTTSELPASDHSLKIETSTTTNHPTSAVPSVIAPVTQKRLLMFRILPSNPILNRYITKIF